jgi:hypothetical protein
MSAPARTSSLHAEGSTTVFNVSTNRLYCESLSAPTVTYRLAVVNAWYGTIDGCAVDQRCACALASKYALPTLASDANCYRNDRARVSWNTGCTTEWAKNVLIDTVSNNDVSIR